MDLEPLDLRETQWIDEIEGNIRRILGEGGTGFVVQDRMREVFGKSLGRARSTHVRTAIKRLHGKAETPTTGIGPSVQKMRVQVAAQTTLGI